MQGGQARANAAPRESKTALALSTVKVVVDAAQRCVRAGRGEEHDRLPAD